MKITNRTDTVLISGPDAGPDAGSDTRLLLPSCLVLLLYILATITTPANASGWSGGVEGGTVVSDAGSQTRLRFNLSNNTRPLTHHLYLEWLRGQDGMDGYAVGYNPRFWITNTYYFFGESRLRTDEVFAIDREISLLAGVGGQLIESSTQALSAEIGLGSRQIEFEMQDEAESQGFGLARLAYYRIFSDLIKFDLDISGVVAEDDVSEYNGEAGISMRVPSGAIRYAYRTRTLKIGDNDSVTNSDSFVSFTYSF
ncbi:MAG: DUF481 domain-containing protein [Granulosicoccus sp.]|nr:DUF481 domain-containing protein [Granulosicoccus sp.]